MASILGPRLIGGDVQGFPEGLISTAQDRLRLRRGGRLSLRFGTAAHRGRRDVKSKGFLGLPPTRCRPSSRRASLSEDRCAGVDGSRRCVRTTPGRCVRALPNWSATSSQPHLRDAIDVSKPDMSFAMLSSAWHVSSNASPKYRRNVGASVKFAATQSPPRGRLGTDADCTVNSSPRVRST